MSKNIINVNKYMLIYLQHFHCILRSGITNIIIIVFMELCKSKHVSIRVYIHICY